MRMKRIAVAALLLGVMKGGEAEYLAPNVVHRGMNLSDAPMKLFVVRIKPKGRASGARGAGAEAMRIVGSGIRSGPGALFVPQGIEPDGPGEQRHAPVEHIHVLTELHAEMIGREAPERGQHRIEDGEGESEGC